MHAKAKFLVKISMYRLIQQCTACLIISNGKEPPHQLEMLVWSFPQILRFGRPVPTPCLR